MFRLSACWNSRPWASSQSIVNTTTCDFLASCHARTERSDQHRLSLYSGRTVQNAAGQLYVSPQETKHRTYQERYQWPLLKSSGMPLRQATPMAGSCLAACGSDMPHIVHWGGDPSASRGLYDAHPQRQGRITPFPSIMPIQSEAWSGKSRFVIRSQGTELSASLTYSFTADHAGVICDEWQVLPDSATPFRAGAERQVRIIAVPHAVVVARASE